MELPEEYMSVDTLPQPKSRDWGYVHINFPFPLLEVKWTSKWWWIFPLGKFGNVSKSKVEHNPYRSRWARMSGHQATISLNGLQGIQGSWAIRMNRKHLKPWTSGSTLSLSGPASRPNLFLKHKHRFYKTKNTVEQNSWVSFPDLMQLTLINPVTRYSSEVLAVETWHLVNIVNVSWHTEKNIYTFTPRNDAKPAKLIGAWDFIVQNASVLNGPLSIWDWD